MKFELKAGVISQSKDHMNMLGDFIVWMDSHEGLFDAMSAWAMKHGTDWKPDDYHVSSIDHDLQDRPETEVNSDCAVAIFDAIADLSQFLPKDHLFGFTEGKLGIFHCPIKIEVVDEPGTMPLKRLERLHRQFEIIEKAQKEIYAEMLDIRDKAESYQDAESVWIAMAAELACRMEAGKFSIGHILRQITRAIARKH